MYSLLKIDIGLFLLLKYKSLNNLFFIIHRTGANCIYKNGEIERLVQAAVLALIDILRFNRCFVYCSGGSLCDTTSEVGYRAISITTSVCGFLRTN